MKRPTPPSTATLRPTSVFLRVVRALRLGLHLFWGAATLALVYPLIAPSLRLWLKQRWSRQLLEILAIRLEADSSAAGPGCLFVANHISWLDIYALNALRPQAFVAKAEVRDWPLIGWLAAHTDTLFIRRGRREDAVEAAAILSRRLQEGLDVAIFPEGTTSDGTRVLEFRPALLQSAIDAERPLQPMAIAYYDAAGRRTTIPAYAGETTMAESLAAILACRQLTVRLQATPLLATVAASRRDLATAARRDIAEALGVLSVEGTLEAARVPERVSAEAIESPGVLVRL